MARIKEIKGIGPEWEKKLIERGMMTTEDLLKAGATTKDREELAKKLGIDTKLVLEWVNRADLHRIKGVGEKYSDLLEDSGVDTVVELSKRVPENLLSKMLEVNEKTKGVKRPPPMGSVKNWVEQAKNLKRVVEY